MGVGLDLLLSYGAFRRRARILNEDAISSIIPSDGSRYTPQMRNWIMGIPYRVSH